MKNRKKDFGLLDNPIRISFSKFSLLGPEFLSSTVNELRNTPKCSHLANRDVFALNLSQDDDKIG